MIFKNIELHNIVEVVKDEKSNSFEMFRVPKTVRDSLESNEQSFRIATNSTGVEFRFIMLSDKVTLRLHKKYTDNNCTYSHFLHSMHIFYGNIQGTWADHNRWLEDDTFDIVIEKPKNIELLKSISKENNYPFSPEIIRVVFDSGFFMLVDVFGDTLPPQKNQCPTKTLLTYGSSITHGSNALDQSHTWASLLANNLNMDLINLGMAGCCCMEDSIVNFISNIGKENQWDMAILELGINVLYWDNEKIYQRVKNTIVKIAGENNDKKVYIISPLYSVDDYQNKGNATRFRKITKQVVDELNYSNVTYIDGLEILDNMKYICADEVHPNIYGVQRIYEKLKNIIK